MGITGLLPLMKGATKDIKLDKLNGTVAAVDTNGWIHRACYHCGDKIYMGEETDMYVKYCLNYVALLRSHDITPILVFDGQSLPAKADTKLKRSKRKAEVRAKIDEMLRMGDEKGARWLMRTCVDVTFDMVHRVIQGCRAQGVDYMVAPFEADAQIAYLVNQGIADYAISEDSDLLVFGCRRVLYKLDRESAKGQMIQLDRVDRCFKNFDQKKFQYMCILSGCDYLDNLPSVAIGRAKKYFELPSTIIANSDKSTISLLLKAIPKALNLPKVKVTDEYIDGFIRARNAFDYQLVYCPFTHGITHLKPLNGGLSEHRIMQLGSYAGEFFDEAKEAPNGAKFDLHYVTGNVDPKTLHVLDLHFDPNGSNRIHGGMWFSEVIAERVRKRAGFTKPQALDSQCSANGAGVKREASDDEVEQLDSKSNSKRVRTKQAGSNVEKKKKKDSKLNRVKEEEEEKKEDSKLYAKNRAKKNEKNSNAKNEEKSLQMPQRRSTRSNCNQLSLNGDDALQFEDEEDEDELQLIELSESQIKHSNSSIESPRRSIRNSNVTKTVESPLRLNSNHKVENGLESPRRSIRNMNATKTIDSPRRLAKNLRSTPVKKLTEPKEFESPRRSMRNTNSKVESPLRSNSNIIKKLAVEDEFESIRNGFESPIRSNQTSSVNSARNVFRKMGEPLKKSRYFADENVLVVPEDEDSNSKDEFEEVRYERRSKPDLNMSTSSIEEEDVQILKCLNARSSSKSNSSSIRTPNKSPNFFDTLKQGQKSSSSSKKNPKSKSNTPKRSQKSHDNSQSDIRSFFCK